MSCMIVAFNEDDHRNDRNPYIALVDCLKKHLRIFTDVGTDHEMSRLLVVVLTKL